MGPMQAVKHSGKSVFNRIEALFALAFPDKWNPFYHLGALSFFFFWIIAFTGLYLFIFFETSITGAYASIEYLTVKQWYLGGIMRSLHRYASAAMAITVTLHLLREFVLDRYRGVRWFSWVTGTPLLWLLFASAIGGYWLGWDQLSEYIAITTAEFLDWLPIMIDPMARNFLNNAALSDRFFSLLVFLHIGIPLALLLGMFFHIQRISYARTFPPRGLALGTLAAMVVFSLAYPALSQAPANLDKAVTSVGLDWFYLNVYPLIESWGPGPVWLLLGGLTLLLFLLPWLPPEKREPIAVVDPANCNGCGWCFADCPYEAVTMKDHDYKKGHKQAVVDPDLCISCGICAGACPSATPFRHVDELVTGIDIPGLPIKDLLALTEKRLAPLSGEQRIMVFGCDHGTALSSIEDAQTATVSMPCAALLPPSFVDFIFRRNLAEGVFVTGCCEEDCYYRLGNTWMDERFAAERMPHLRTRGAKDSVRVAWTGPTGLGRLRGELDEYRNHLRAADETSAVMEEVVND